MVKRKKDRGWNYNLPEIEVSDEAFVAIRRDTYEGKHWIDLETMSHSKAHCKVKAKNVSLETGRQWSKDNPVSTFAKVSIEVIDYD